MAIDRDKRDEDFAFAQEAIVLLDARLSDLWSAVWSSGVEQLPHDAVGRLLRLAYLSGYQDALVEPTRGQLFKEVGIPVPRRVNSREPSPGP